MHGTALSVGQWLLGWANWCGRRPVPASTPRSIAEALNTPPSISLVKRKGLRLAAGIAIGQRLAPVQMFETDFRDTWIRGRAYRL